MRKLTVSRDSALKEWYICLRKCISNPFFPTNTRYILSLNLLPFYLSTFLPLITPVPIFARHQAPCIIHVHSTFSENGKRSIEEIVVKARDRGIKVLILSDHDLMKWEYGIFPLRKIIKKKVEKNSVLLIGADKFLKEIERVQKKYPDILIIPGIESSPFYWWSGSPFKGDLTLNGWNKHLLIAGLYKKQDYENLPLVGNTTASRIDVIKFWPLLLVFTGILTGIKKRGGLFLIVLGFSFLVYNYPFSTFEFNQYNGDRVELPYQRVIDYVNEKGGVTFWAHPEAPNYEIPVKVGKISVRTNRYPESILKTFNYTGFAYFWEGNEIVGSPGGYWDRTLTDYCRNTRDKPVWAISELDYTDDGANNTWLGLNKN
ncbi:MAG: PHP domain-containing protein, partial [Elusimicrobiota bacterium]